MADMTKNDALGVFEVRIKQFRHIYDTPLPQVNLEQAIKARLAELNYLASIIFDANDERLQGRIGHP